jgi:hypothetical protein
MSAAAQGLSEFEQFSAGIISSKRYPQSILAIGTSVDLI